MISIEQLHPTKATQVRVISGPFKAMSRRQAFAEGERVKLTTVGNAPYYHTRAIGYAKPEEIEAWDNRESAETVRTLANNMRHFAEAETSFGRVVTMTPETRDLVVEYLLELADRKESA